MKLCLPALVLGFVVAVSAPAQPTPNILVILSDDQGWTGLSAEMDPNGLGPLSASDFYETPNLETLASQGMRFRQAYSAAPNCSPTRASIQTGMSPASLNLTDIVGRGDLYTGGVTDNFYAGNDLIAPFGASRLPTQVESIAQRIKDANSSYVTAHLGKWHLTTPSVQPSSPGGSVPYRPGDPSDYGYDVHDGARTNNPISTTSDPKEMFSLTSRAIDFMDDRAGTSGDSNPFYLQLSHYAVHSRDDTLPATQAKYDAKFQTDPGVRHPDGANNTTFAGMTEDLDTTVGQLLSYLDSTPDPRNPGHMLADNTYLVYIADNGATEASSSNLPLYDEKASTWEGGIRVPLMIRGPGVTANTVSDVPVVSTDLYATLTKLAGSTAPLSAVSESADLTDLLLNEGELPTPSNQLQRGTAANGDLFFHFPHYQIQKGTSPMSAMVDGTGQFKLVRIYQPNAAPLDYLFDLNAPISGPFDTWETADFADARNLANDPAYASQLGSMQQRFDDWVQAVDASLPYVVGNPVAMKWDANDNNRARGVEGPEWRSVTDVDARFREQLLIDESAGNVDVVNISPSQSELGSQAYHMDSGGGFLRSFFHVAELDPSSPRLTQPADTNNSASFEFWLRADALNQGQVLLETGGGDKGLSLTLGDGDNDGQFDDVQLRAASDSDGRALITTASLAGTNITSEFVHLVAVIDHNTQANTQSALLYLNGQLAASSNSVIGGGTVDWQGTDSAGIGMVQGVLGSSGGPGEAPLGTAGFAGDIGQFGFYNYALSAGDVENLSNFEEVSFVLGDLDGDGVLTSADIAEFQLRWLADTSGLASTIDRYRAGDLDASGRVSLVDWKLLRQLFADQNLLALFEGGAAVPEPSALLTAGVSVGFLGTALRIRSK